jgi:hypothetical protein
MSPKKQRPGLREREMLCWFSMLVATSRPSAEADIPKRDRHRAREEKNDMTGSQDKVFQKDEYWTMAKLCVCGVV